MRSEEAMTNGSEVMTGLTKREYLAGLAMQGLMSDSTTEGSYQTLARVSIDMAEALLEEIANGY